MNDEGLDGTWLVTHGAHMAWRYARSVQATLADIDAALAEGNWRLAVESCALALRGIVFCRLVGAGLRGTPAESELEARLALDDSPAAAALRALPWPVHAGEAEARAAAAVVAEHDAALRAELPFDLPVIRVAEGHAPTVRITATIARWRAERGMGPVDWNRDGL
ncbi:hypothetical protein LX15_001833 [Streptoalloteichus tenebrarius]|uniref:HEPN domain-containing protein n=1 Tax=Streptoalloteichus tenebrarius (strain ATCC 17920 / DSM 40477 / JCM 4838 / CBS 697.72 / NBRC 16177 / NCIMB 11028 / NRRL B-12390 / A12253. 1 / ISP 5477) TaxID=1933 RepID=A0ABT1HRK2_STRSD|nr:hypothetical protein [Streptoalloteichus tenebrarius]MCP2258139.1 hypothetical protein [Streptoalloteichus tenebrarius]BFF04634.1 hypothetical protein GCM10020241_63090 [Streptoalloteichus tenebrarius]